MPLIDELGTLVGIVVAGALVRSGSARLGRCNILQPVPDVDDAPLARFDRSLISDLDEPVRRFFTHAIGDGAPLGGGVGLGMTGRIRVGTWLPFTAEQTADGRSFAWRARVGWGRITPLHVVDRYADGAGVTEGRLLGRLRRRRPQYHPVGRDARRVGERRLRAAQRAAQPRRDVERRD